MSSWRSPRRVLNSPPCKDCARKGCGEYHDKCLKFAEFKAKQDAVYRKHREAVEQRADYTTRIKEMHK